MDSQRQGQVPGAGLILRGEPISLKSPQGAGVKAFPLLRGQLWGFPLPKETWGFSPTGSSDVLFPELIGFPLTLALSTAEITCLCGVCCVQRDTVCM